MTCCRPKAELDSKQRDRQPLEDNVNGLQQNYASVEQLPYQTHPAVEKIIEHSLSRIETPSVSRAATSSGLKESEEHSERLSTCRNLQNQRGKTNRKFIADKSQTSRDAYQRSHDRDPTAAQTASSSKKGRLRLHAEPGQGREFVDGPDTYREDFLCTINSYRQRVPAVTFPAWRFWLAFAGG